jgi:hypothetical protein
MKSRDIVAGEMTPGRIAEVERNGARWKLKTNGGKTRTHYWKPVSEAPKMTTPSNDPRQTELASKFTVSDYEAACKTQERGKIAEALHRRFTERYIDPVTPKRDRQMHGFTMMAVSCLMIESLESFCRGWENSNGKSELAFCHFFDTHRQFDGLRGHSAEFYKNVRCGILHQAETTGGWRITRKSSAPLFSPDPLPTVNATLFLQHLREVLDGFRDGLNAADWNSEDWQYVRTKMRALCHNCCP